jgi:hypothetical protein
MYEAAHAMNLCDQTESSKSGGLLAAGHQFFRSFALDYRQNT